MSKKKSVDKSTKQNNAKMNFIKTRDDNDFVAFEVIDKNKFKLCSGSNCSWLNSEEEFTVQKLRPRIEPWLTSLFQSEHLTLLAGSGLMHAVHFLAAKKGAAGMELIKFTQYDNEINIASKASAIRTGRKEGNFEDQIRVANELSRGLDILKDETDFDDKTAQILNTEIEISLKNLAENILKSEATITTAKEEDREIAFNTLISFLMSFASRTGTRDRLNIFTTNYDRLIEAGAELAGLHLLDRFLGNLMPVFRSSRLDLDLHYNPPGIRGEPRYLEGVARYTKLHGSIDWVQAGRDIRRVGLPFGAESVEPYLRAPALKGATAHEMIIYPNDAKDRETAAYPYVELFRDFAAATCRPNSTVVTYGYSFGDEHINRIIEDMLTIPSTHLVIISFDDPLDRIAEFYNKRQSQITLLVGNYLGDLKTLTDNYLPKSAIDKATIRMSEMLKNRLDPQPLNSAESEVMKSTSITDNSEVKE